MDREQIERVILDAAEDREAYESRGAAALGLAVLDLADALRDLARVLERQDQK